MNLENIKQHSMKMILQFSVPSIIAMVLTALINVVDGIFTGRFVGSAGMSAIELGLPIVYFYLAVGLMISVGGIAIAGRLYGAGDTAKAGNVFNQTMTVCTGASVAISIVLFFGLPSIAQAMDLQNEVRTYFLNYYYIMLAELPVMIVNSSLGMFIRGEGHPQFFMMTSIVTLAMNIIFDDLLAGVFHYGIQGIAYASVLASLSACVLNAVFILKAMKIYRFASFRFDRDVQKEMILNGSSEFIGEMTMFISMAAYNYVILNRFGISVLTAFTIVGFVSYIYSMIVLGFGQGIIPLVSFCYGAKDPRTSAHLRRLTSYLTSGTAAVIMFAMALAAVPYCRMFLSDPEIIAMASSGILINMTSFLFAGCNCIVSMYFTAIGHAKESAVISSARGFVILLAAIFILPAVCGITGLWLVSTVSEALTALISLAYLKKDSRMICQQKA